MFTDNQGIIRIAKKWGDFVKSATDRDKESRLCFVKVNKNTMYASTGRQCVKISIPLEFEDRPEPGLYYITTENILVATHDKEVEFPKIEELFSVEDKSKTAAISLAGLPITAMVCAIKEFDCFVNLDTFKKTLTYLGDLTPENARLYGYEDKEESAASPLILNCNVGRIDISYMMVPFNCVESDMLKVDPTPMLWENQE
ncbi:hypothetical protein KAR91_45255 [Candidatus Pacearchaeota archaeon]|nr:hypothetical protein [Candidatus Pacearchaeota archaeon]